MKPEIVVGDITCIAVDAIVNAANERLRGGGGVDGAIHRAAGPEMIEACKRHSNCPTGEVRVTPAFALPARWVIHAVEPVWDGGDADEDVLLANAYSSAFAAATDIGASSISFPAISTGIYGFSRERAARIALGEVNAWLEQDRDPRRVVLVCFDRDLAAIYDRLLGENLGQT